MCFFNMDGIGRVYANCADAIHDAVLLRDLENPQPFGIAYIQGKGWYSYDVTQGCKLGSPEIFCRFKRVGGYTLLDKFPLSEEAVDVLLSMK